jgi:hypothetical protein
MLRVAFCVALLTSGCAIHPQPSPPARTKIVTLKETGRTCRVTTRPATTDEFCSTPKNCPQISSCAEAYYRLTVCKHEWLDGGTARGTYEKPNGNGQPNGIPCEDKCGSDARAMVMRIWAQEKENHFTLPVVTSEKCNPAETGHSSG